jgi:hypothetical protein
LRASETTGYAVAVVVVGGGGDEDRCEFPCLVASAAAAAAAVAADDSVVDLIGCFVCSGGLVDQWSWIRSGEAPLEWA